ncbi:extensin [Iris pallida]|uniref:Extensin n=1 Tax=Iris pallida TaxID=29817 RepID=A0AAX6IMN0_IRIPA|nr:extensin [Iris pallida]
MEKSSGGWWLRRSSAPMAGLAGWRSGAVEKKAATVIRARGGGMGVGRGRGRRRMASPAAKVSAVRRSGAARSALADAVATGTVVRSKRR